MRRSVSLLAAAAAVTPVLWFQAWPVGDLACNDKDYKFQVALENPSNREAADYAKAQACKTVNSWPL